MNGSFLEDFAIRHILSVTRWPVLWSGNASIPVELPTGALLIDVASGAVAILVGLTGLMAGTAHYLAVLAGRNQRKVDVHTGSGFFVGMCIGAGLFLLELIV